jgi:GntR family transcriptional regulator, transcriptional repressor for pyruvate dehydrogenase complex
MTVEPLRPQAIRGASEQVAVQIQHHIQRQGLAPGSFLGREGDLAERFGVSRPTVREALKLLTGANLVRATKGPGGGIYVAHTAEQGMSRSLSDAIAMMLDTGAVSLEELLDARVMLEGPLAAAAAYQSDEAMLERLREAVRAERATRGVVGWVGGRGAPGGPPPAAAGDETALDAADREFHRTIAAAAGNRMMEALTGWVFDVLQPQLRALLHGAMIQSAIVEQHETLVTAIEKGDPARAERAMTDHLLYLRDVLAIVRAR